MIGWVSASGQRNDYWVDNDANWGGYTAMADPITKATESAEWTIWRQKLSQYKVKIGVQPTKAR